MVRPMRRDDILAALERHRGKLHDLGVASVAVFGSAARDEAGPASDIDLLVEFDRPIGMFHFLAVKEELERILGREVDLVTPDALKPHYRERVLEEAVFAA